ncbi:MAG: hypothetical protein LBU32_00150 [Clostridiales bacterium]|nr:hypothetical protein [Clostridiales bacterium]
MSRPCIMASFRTNSTAVSASGFRGFTGEPCHGADGRQGYVALHGPCAMVPVWISTSVCTGYAFLLKTLDFEVGI